MGKKNKNKKFKSILGFKKENKKEINEVSFNEIFAGGSLIPLNEEDMELECNLKVVLTKEVHNKIRTQTNLIDNEITGLGLVDIKNNIARVYDVFLVKQIVSGASCELDEVGICELVDKLIAEGKNPKHLRFWWHSHANMGVNWSNTDEDTGEKFGGNTFFLSLVINHKGEMRARINVYNPIKLMLDNLPVFVESSEIKEDFINDMKTEIQDKVFEKKFKYANTFWDNKDREAREKKEKEEKEENNQKEGKVDTRETFKITDAKDIYFNFIYNGVRFEFNQENKRYEYISATSGLPLCVDDVKLLTGETVVNILIDKIREFKKTHKQQK